MLPLRAKSSEIVDARCDAGLLVNFGQSGIKMFAITREADVACIRRASALGQKQSQQRWGATQFKGPGIIRQDLISNSDTLLSRAETTIARPLILHSFLSALVSR
jgi:hypothetical protein